MIYRSLKVGTFSVRCKITGTDFPRHYMDYGLYYHYSGYTFPHIAERKKRDTFAWYDTNNKTVMEEIMQLDNVFQYNELLYDYQEGTLVFIAPGQCVGITRRGEMFQPKGWALLFHPDFIRGTQLGRNIRNYTFFSYAVNEALHLSQQERGTIVDCLHNIRAELQHPIDRHSRTLIINNIEMFLNYCIRFYDRQFVTRSEIANKDILSRFEEILNGYFRSDRPQTIGLPTVQYCARELHLSPNYFGDLIKKETGKTAQEHIQLYVIDTAKERIADRGLSISEIAYDLGFKYPAHFTRLFKNVVGCTPNEYRATC